MSNDYTYAVARIRALEARMINPVQLSRMTEAPDLEKAFFVVNETAYSEHISSSTHPFNFEQIVRDELACVRAVLERLAGGDPALELVWRKYDYSNIKVLVRAKYGKIDDWQSYITKLGNVDVEELGNYILKGEGSLPSPLRDEIDSVIVLFEEEKDIRAVDNYLDGLYLKALAGSGVSLLVKLAKIWASSPHPFDLPGDNTTVDMIRRIRRKAFGVEPLVAFWLAKELEAKTVKIILTSKKHRLRTDEVKRRIRDIYV